MIDCDNIVSWRIPDSNCRQRRLVTTAPRPITLGRYRWTRFYLNLSILLKAFTRLGFLFLFLFVRLGDDKKTELDSTFSKWRLTENEKKFKLNVKHIFRNLIRVKNSFLKNRTHRGTSQAERRRDVGKIQRIAVIVPTSLTNLCQWQVKQAHTHFLHVLPLSLSLSLTHTHTCT